MYNHLGFVLTQFYLFFRFFVLFFFFPLYQIVCTKYLPKTSLYICLTEGGFSAVWYKLAYLVSLFGIFQNFHCNIDFSLFVT